MEKQPEINTGVQIPKAAFDELEFIRRSGATNMLDRPTVLHLAREWDLTEIADWIERVDTGTYGRLILQGPDIIETDLTTHSVENEPDAQDDEGDIGRVGQEIDEEGANLRKVIATLGKHASRKVIATLGKQASLTIADTYDTELMGVLIGSPRLHEINTERTELIRNLVEAASLSLRLEEVLTEVDRGIGALQYMIDPENN